jgi:hypothetical protein
MTAYDFILSRAVSALTGESGAPSASAFTSRLQTPAPFVEIAGTGLSTSGTPTTITFTVYRLHGVHVHKLGSFGVADADIGNFVPQIFECGSDKVWILVSFTGGSTPSLTGSILARPIFGI